ncbi:MAG: ABC transporter permease [Erythrobacter sp.]|uniref:ABC transporter permease n=1 Tax=Erythrobacter sp. TaxID=1042 RepID=UPI00261F77BF|nr:ABC transporter permease [Erythrobacter sp.]MDJ0977435.1 ABC transporter permease [Erythrobacter sp.]
MATASELLPSASPTRNPMASLAVNFAIAMTALRTNVMRSVLTMLGVLIGVFAVTLAVAVGNGAREAVTETIDGFGSNMAILIPRPDDDEGGPPRRTDSERGRLTQRDVDAIEREVPLVRATAPQLRQSFDIVVPGASASTEVVGTTPGYEIATVHSVDRGRYISNTDVRSSARVVVLGRTVSETLFGEADPIGETVRVNGVPFAIIGLLEEKGSTLGDDTDDTMLMPITTMRQRFVGDTLPGPDDLQLAFVAFQEGASLSRGKTEIIALLKDRYNVEFGDVTPFTVRTTEEFVEQSQFITGILQGVLVAIASISLLVGGIGIMNIMLVSVTERTREIGLRMALGARRSDIRNQFLVEAAVLCMLGGAVGIILAWLTGVTLEASFDFPVPVGIATAIGAVVFSAFIGLVFGGYPAIRASRLSPIEALRTE